MNGRDQLQFDDQGFVSMDQFDDSDPDQALDAAASEAVHAALIEASVPAPSPDRFDTWVEHAITAEAQAPEIAQLVPPDDDAVEDESPGWPVDSSPDDDLSSGWEPTTPGDLETEETEGLLDDPDDFEPPPSG